MRTAFYLASMLIVYGSAYPFIFSMDQWEQALNLFLNSVWGQISIGDLLGNIALFIPFGFLGYLFYHQQGLQRASVMGHVITKGILLALISQIVQLVIPARDPALYDVYWNVLGILGGVLIAGIPSLRRLVLHHDQKLIFSIPVVLLVLWLSYRLAPFVPTIDLQAYKNALKPVFVSPVLTGSDLLLQTGGWILYGVAVARLLNSSKVWLATATGLMILVCEIIIVDNVITLTDIVAWGLAVGCAVLSGHQRFYIFLAVGLLLGWLISAAFPFALGPVSFNWIPFSGFLGGSIIHGVIALAQKVFVYSGALWCLTLGGIRLRHSTMGLLTGVFLIEVMQSFNAYHTADITDLIYVAFAYWLNKTATDNVQSRQAILPTVIDIQSESTTANRLPLWRFLGGIILAVVLVALSGYILVRLPGVPYNIRDMFWQGGNSLDLLFFGCAGVWLVMAPIGCGHFSAYSPRPWLWILGSGIGVPAIFYFLLANAITGETIADLAGSNHWAHLQGLENTMRLGALFVPIVLFSTLIYYLIFSYRMAQQVALHRLMKAFLLGLIAALPLLIAVRLVVFTFSVTDNITELLEQASPVGGGWALLALCLWFAWSTAFAAHWLETWRGAIKAVTLLLISLPFSWFLLNAALTDVVVKGGQAFSPLNFLLAPEKQAHLPDIILFARWCLVMMVLQIGWVMLGRFYLYIYAGRQQRHTQRDTSQQPTLKKVTQTNGVLLLNIHIDQLSFLTELGKARHESISVTLNEVLDYFREHTLAHEQAEALANRLSQTFLPVNHTAFTQIKVTLTPANAELLKACAQFVNQGESRLLRHLVALFIVECSEE